MARKTKDDKSSEPPAGTISIDEFNLTRDRVVHGLNHLQVAVSKLLGAYLEHCKTITGEGGSVDASTLAIAGISFGDLAPAALTAPVDAKGKKKKVKKERDPNAPKRPLTAAFLFGQSARMIVKHDLEASLQPGEKLAPNAVNEEVTRRWNALDDASKEAWREEYRKNLTTYREKVQVYEAGRLPPVEPDAEGEAENVVAGAVAPVDFDAEGSSDEESAKEPTPPPKAPSPPPASAGKGNKRRKTTKENGATPSGGSEVPLPGATSSRASIVPLPGTTVTTPVPEKAPTKKAAGKKGKADSPEAPKKRAPAKKGKEEAPASDPVVAAEPEKKTSKRKRKGDA